jgi:mono/diheme cytochrome c family protein
MRNAVLLVLLGALPWAGDVYADDGEALFKSRCSGCHSPQKASAKARKLPEGEREGYLQTFISKHSPIDEDQRREVVDYLLKVPG